MPEQHFDAIIIGAGISGISAAYHLQTYCPGKSYKILERRSAMGGTWDLFNYPGIRSDSDMYTFGFSFKPWNDNAAIAEKSKIISYLKETTSEFGIDRHIQYGVGVSRASWSSEQGLWHVTSTDEATGKVEQFSCQHLFMCVGYYNYDHGYTPEFVGSHDFKGDLIHPQHWPEDFNYENKKVVVIGSGATAITLVPSMADKAKHVTMLQRSPTYLGAKPAIDPIANGLANWFGRRAARWWFILQSMFIYHYCKRYPEKAKAAMLADIKKRLGDNYEEKHYSPSYDPWDQRVCLCPDGDFFDAINSGKASVATDHIERFTNTGILLTSGQELDADVIVTATGLDVLFLGGIEIEVDGEMLKANETYVYKGFMGSNTPNMYIATGYTNASWTLKVDLTHRHACRLINHLDKHNFAYSVPQVPADIVSAPLLDLDSGYIKRGEAGLPKQGTVKPWKLNQNFILDNIALRFNSIKNSAMHFVSR